MLAHACKRAVTASSSCLASGLPGSLMRVFPAAPLAKPMTVSLVLVSPSTEICPRHSHLIPKGKQQSSFPTSRILEWTGCITATMAYHKTLPALTWLKLLMAPRRTMSCHSNSSTAASEVITLSMVAMLGWIMPDPLAMPPTRTFAPPISTCATP